MIILLVFLTAVCTVTISFIFPAGEIFDNKKRGLNKITKKGRLIIMLSALLILLPVIQNWLQDQKDNKKEKQEKLDSHIRDSTSQVQSDKRDSILRNDYSNSVERIIDQNANANSVTTEILTRYGYRLDTLNKTLVKIKDSSKTRVVEPESPTLELRAGSEITDSGLNELGRHQYYLNIMSLGAASTNFELLNSMILEDSIGKDTYSGKYKLFYKKMRIAGTEGKTFGFTLDKEVKPTVLIFWIRGTYSNLDNTKTFSIDDVYEYNFKKKQTRTVTSEEYIKRAREFVQRNE